MLIGYRYIRSFENLAALNVVTTLHDKIPYDGE